MDVFGYFDSLGGRVEQEWAKRRNDEFAFPEVAAKVLTEFDEPGFDATDLLAAVASAPSLPKQADAEATFGSPPVTVYRSRDFFVSVLYWFDSTTAIHEHGFSGAFKVFTGSSIHSVYTHELHERINSHLLFGNLQFQGAEHLRKGDVREILTGDQGIHALFHLEQPSATIVVRTYADPTGRPQYNHLKPGVAYDPFYRRENVERSFQALDAVRRVDVDRAYDAAATMVDDLDLFAGFLLLNRWAHVESGERFDALAHRFVQRHGSPTDMLLTSFEEMRREHALISRRRMVRDPRQRAFLALLLNLPDRASTEALLAQMYPERDSRELLVELLREMASPEHRGLSGIVLTPEELAGIEEALLEGGDDAETNLRALSGRVRRSDVLTRLFG